MKIQCDVCTAESATVFCCADEAALCADCDRRVHSANKLAEKHRRISLSSSDASPPLCDICQEKRGFIFCQEDRAVLCKDCDEPIHSKNDLTKKHNRFLLAGDRLSSTSMPEFIDEQEKLSQVSTDESNISSNHKNNSSSSSTISEYLIKTLPGWQVEDLLEDDSCDFFLSNEIDLGIAEEELPKWTAPQVPQAPPALVVNFAVKTSLPERWSDEHAFRVPQMSAMNAEKHKRARTMNSNSTSMPSSSSSLYY